MVADSGRAARLPCRLFDHVGLPQFRFGTIWDAMSRNGEPVALVSGVGPGTGKAIVRRFASGGYRVAMLARNRERLAALESEIPETLGIACDVADEGQVDAAVAAVRAQ